MDILNDPQYKNKYRTCKYIVKSWENEFKSKYGRIPSKHDIREANEITKNAYRDYFYIKTKALEETLTDVDLSFDSNLDKVTDNKLVHDDTENIISMKVEKQLLDVTNKKEEVETDQSNNEDVWGSHLNKKNDIKEIQPKSQLNSSISLSQKLFAGSKFKKKIPRKSASFSHQKSATDLNLLISASQPDPLSNENDTNFASIFGENFKVIQTTTPTFTQPVSIIQKAITSFSDLTPLRKIDRGWLDRTGVDNFEISNKIIPSENDSGIDSFGSSPPREEKQNNEFGLSNVSFANYTINSKTEDKYDAKSLSDSDGIVCNSESEDEKSLSQHVIKKRKILIEKPSIENEIVQNRGQITNQSTDLNETIKSAQNKFGTLDKLNHEQQKKSKTNKTLSSKPKRNVNTGNKEKTRRTTLNRLVKNKKLSTLLDDCTEEQFHSDNDHENDSNFSEEDDDSVSNIKKSITNRKKAQKCTKKSPHLKKNKPKTAVRMEFDKTNDDNYSELPRTPLPETVPRFKLSNDVITNIVNISKNKEKKISNTVTTKNKLTKKIENGSLNENFVRINLKKKVFVRGKKTLTYSKYKNKQWATKKKIGALAGPDMDMRGCDGGMLTCFKCGEVGHFARNCKADQGDNLLPIEADSEDISPYPTLEEAAVMASKSKLTRHITSKNLLSQNSNVNNQVQMQIADESYNSGSDLEDNELMNMMEEIESQFIARHPIPQGIIQSNEVKPLYKLNSNGSLIDTPQEVFEALHLFGHTSFRPGQERAIMRTLSGQSTLVTLSTGSGKSLCYQLPAYLYAKKHHPCIALVVSPLVSLMEDQVTRSDNIGCLHTNMTKTAREKVLEKLKAGSFNALLVSPEAIVTNCDYLLRFLPPISFACIDEVHCVSQWSYNFRPSYLTVCRVLQERLNIKIMLGLTATAPLVTRHSIIKHLKVPDGDAGLVGSTDLPSNLTLTASKDKHKDIALISMLKSDKFYNFNSIVIYCTRRYECERLAGLLRTSFKEEELEQNKKKRKRFSWIAESYHAGLSASRRRTIQNAFMSGELKIVVATIAFGMGINKSDIRVVIHYNMPRNFESYVQEVGRAGRDGLPAYCHLFLDSNDNDQNELRRHIFSDSIDRHVIRKLLQRVFISCDCSTRGISCPKHEVGFPIEDTVRALDIPEENISTLLCYLELHEKRFIEVLTPSYTKCKITSYGGPAVLKKAAQDCAPLAIAIALEKERGHSVDTMNVIEFPVIDIAAAIGWDSGVVKYHLKNLEWTTENGSIKRSNITVSLFSLGFRIRGPGDLTPEDLDTALDTLHNRVMQQEHSSLIQLKNIHKVFTEIATTSYDVTETIAKVNSDKLKERILQHFENENSSDSTAVIENKKIENVSQIINDVQNMISMYRDNTFTGRSLARIFQGISSPNYPAVVWGRCKYWRAHLDSDFNMICKIATQEILRMR